MRAKNVIFAIFSRILKFYILNLEFYVDIIIPMLQCQEYVQEQNPDLMR